MKKAFVESFQAVGKPMEFDIVERQILSHTYRARRRDAADPSTWKWEKNFAKYRGVDVDLFRAPSGRRYIVRTLREDQPPIHVGNRFETLIEAAKRRILFEKPVAVFTTQRKGLFDNEYGVHYASEYVEGKTLLELWKSKTKEGDFGDFGYWPHAGRYELAAKTIGLLRRLHEAGAIHGHPHLSNIVVRERTGHPILIDPTKMEFSIPGHGGYTIPENRKIWDLALFTNRAIKAGLILPGELKRLLTENYVKDPAKASVLAKQLAELGPQTE